MCVRMYVAKYLVELERRNNEKIAKRLKYYFYKCSLMYNGAVTNIPYIYTKIKNKNNKKKLLFKL